MRVAHLQTRPKSTEYYPKSFLFTTPQPMISLEVENCKLSLSEFCKTKWLNACMPWYRNELLKVLLTSHSMISDSGYHRSLRTLFIVSDSDIFPTHAPYGSSISQ